MMSPREHDKPDDAIPDVQRRFLERQLDAPADPQDERQAQGWQTDFEGRPIDPETDKPLSRADGIALGGALPFIVLVLGVVFVAFAFLSSQYSLAPYDPSTLGPPDKQIEEVVREVFRDSSITTGTLTGANFAQPLELLEIGKVKDPPFDMPFMQRVNETDAEIYGGTFQRLTPALIQPDPSSVVERIEYERTDKATGSIEPRTLLVVRVRKGWRIVAFE